MVDALLISQYPARMMGNCLVFAIANTAGGVVVIGIKAPVYGTPCSRIVATTLLVLLAKRAPIRRAVGVADASDGTVPDVIVELEIVVVVVAVDMDLVSMLSVEQKLSLG